MESDLIKKLLNDVELKLDWDDSNLWTTHDFEELSEKILRKTTINLSVTTLKRLWGKINYDSKPTITTLNTLAQFIDFENWRDYKQDVRLTNPKDKIFLKERMSVKMKILFTGLITVLLVVFIILFFKSDSENSRKFSSDQFSFNSKKVVPIGVPNSVIFTYDATAASETDLVEFQQSWDERLRTTLKRDKKKYNSIYYYPGYFKAKLIVNDSIMKELGVLIKTDGWLTLAERDATKPPFYFNKEDAFSIDGVMTLPMDKILAKNVRREPTPMWTSHFNISDFENELLSDNFLFETEIRNDFTEIVGLCQYIHVVLYFEGAMLYLPFSFKGCVSNLSLYDTNGIMDVDVSALGFEPNQWMKLRVEVKNEKGKIYINDKLEYDFNFHFKTPARFVGIKYNFQGTGSVKYTKLFNVDNIAIFDEDY